MTSTEDFQALAAELASLGVTVRSSEVSTCNEEDIPALLELYNMYLTYAKQMKNIREEAIRNADFDAFSETISAMIASLKARQSQLKSFVTFHDFGKILAQALGMAQTASNIKAADFQAHHWGAWLEDLRDSSIHELSSESEVCTLFQAMELQKREQLLPSLIHKASTESAARVKITQIKDSFGEQSITCTGNGALVLDLALRELAVMDEGLGVINAMRATETVHPWPPAFHDILTNLQSMRQCLFQWTESTTTIHSLQPILTNPLVIKALPTAGANYTVASSLYEKICLSFQRTTKANETVTQTVNEVMGQERVQFRADVAELYQKLHEAHRIVASTIQGLRRSFPRFHLLSDGELLQILSASTANDITGFCNIVVKVLMDVVKMDLSEDGTKIVALLGADGECLPLSPPVEVSGVSPDKVITSIILAMRRALRAGVDRLEATCAKGRVERITPLEMCKAFTAELPQLGLLGILAAYTTAAQDAFGVTTQEEQPLARQTGLLPLAGPIVGRPQTAPQKMRPPTAKKGGYSTQSPAVRLEHLTQSRCASALTEPRPGSAMTAGGKRRGSADVKRDAKKGTKKEDDKANTQQQTRGRPLSAGPSAATRGYVRSPPKVQQSTYVTSKKMGCSLTSLGRKKVTNFITDMTGALRSIIRSPLVALMRRRAEQLTLLQHQLSTHWTQGAQYNMESDPGYPRANLCGSQPSISVLDVSFPYECEFHGKSIPFVLTEDTVSLWEQVAIATRIKSHLLSIGQKGSRTNESVQQLSYLCGKFMANVDVPSSPESINMSEIMGILVGIYTSGCWGTVGHLHHLPREKIATLATLTNQLTAIGRSGDDVINVNGQEWLVKPGGLLFCTMELGPMQHIPEVLGTAFHVTKTWLPDAQAVLASNLSAAGFNEATPLATRLNLLLDMTKDRDKTFNISEFLSSLVSAIRKAGMLLRRDRGAEDITLVHAIKTFALPRLSPTHASIFEGLLQDVFQQCSSQIVFVPFQSALQEFCESKSLSVEIPWTENVLQLLELVRQYSTVAVVGSSPVGKTSAIQCVAIGIEKLYSTPIKVTTVHHEGMTIEQFDSVIALNGQKTNWLVLDGSLSETLWAANQGKYDKILLETADLANMTPALASAIGILHFNSHLIPQTYTLKGIRSKAAPVAIQLMEKNWHITRAFLEVVNISVSHIKDNAFVEIFDGILADVPEPSPEQSERAFWYALSWAYVGEASAIVREKWCHEVFCSLSPKNVHMSGQDQQVMVNIFHHVLDAKAQWVLSTSVPPLTIRDVVKMRTRVFDDLILTTPLMTTLKVARYLKKSPMMIIGEAGVGKSLFLRHMFPAQGLAHGFAQCKLMSTTTSNGICELLNFLGDKFRKTATLCIDDVNLGSIQVQSNIRQAMTDQQVYLTARFPKDIGTVMVKTWVATSNQVSGILPRLRNRFMPLALTGENTDGDIAASMTGIMDTIFKSLTGANQLGRIAASVLEGAAWHYVVKFFRLLSQCELESGLTRIAVTDCLRMLKLPTNAVDNACSSMDAAHLLIDPQNLWVVKDTTAQMMSNKNIGLGFPSKEGVFVHSDFTALIASLSRVVSLPAGNAILPGPPGIGRKTAVATLCAWKGLAFFSPRSFEELHGQMKLTCAKAARGQAQVILISHTMAEQPEVQALVESCVKTGVPDDIFTPAERPSLKTDGDKFGCDSTDQYYAFQRVARDHLHFIIVIDNLESLHESCRQSLVRQCFVLNVPRLSKESVRSLVHSVCAVQENNEGGDAFVDMYEVAAAALGASGHHITVPAILDGIMHYRRRNLESEPDRQAALENVHQQLVTLRNLRYEMSLLSNGPGPEKNFKPEPSTLIEGSLKHKMFLTEPFRVIMQFGFSESFEGRITEVKNCALFTALGSTEILVFPISIPNGTCKSTVSQNENANRAFVTLAVGNNYEFRGWVTIIKTVSGESSTTFEGDLFEGPNMVAVFTGGSVSVTTIPSVRWLRSGCESPSEASALLSSVKINAENSKIVAQEIVRIEKSYMEGVRLRREHAVHVAVTSALALYGRSYEVHSLLDTKLEEWSKINPRFMPRHQNYLGVSSGEFTSTVKDNVDAGMPMGQHWQTIFVLTQKVHSKICLLDDPDGISIPWLCRSHPGSTIVSANAGAFPFDSSFLIITDVSSANWSSMCLALNLGDCRARPGMIFVGKGPYNGDMEGCLRIISCRPQKGELVDQFTEMLLLSEKPEIFQQMTDAGKAALVAEETFQKFPVPNWTTMSAAVKCLTEPATNDLLAKIVEAQKAYTYALDRQKTIKENYYKERSAYQEVCVLAASFVTSAKDMVAFENSIAYSHDMFISSFRRVTAPPEAMGITRMNELRARVINYLCNVILRTLPDQRRFAYAFLSALRHQLTMRDVDPSCCAEYLRGINHVDILGHLEWEKEEREVIERNFQAKTARWHHEQSHETADDGALKGKPKATVVEPDSKTKAKTKEVPAPTREPLPFRHKPPYPFLNDTAWAGVLHLADTIKPLEKILEAIHDREKNSKNPKEQKWKDWVDEPTGRAPEVEREHKLSSLHRMLLTASLRPDRRLLGGVQYINEVFNNNVDPFVATEDSASLEAIEMANARTPFMVLLQAGEDYSGLQFIETASVTANAEITANSIIALHSRNEQEALNFVRVCRLKGSWAVLLDVEMASSGFLDELYALVTSTVEEPVESFRLILTWNASVPCAEHPLVTASVRLTRCVQRTVKQSMLRMYATMSEETLRPLRHPGWMQALYGMQVVASILDSRRRFGMYGFQNVADASRCALKAPYLLTLLEDMLAQNNSLVVKTKQVPWALIRFATLKLLSSTMCAEDRHVTSALVDWWLHPDLCKSGAQWSKGYRTPDDASLKGHLHSIEAMPPVDAPELFGLSSIAERAYSDTVMEDALSMARRTLFTSVNQKVDVIAELCDRALEILKVVSDLEPWHVYLASIDSCTAKATNALRLVRVELLTTARLTALVFRTLLEKGGTSENTLRALFFGFIPDAWMALSGDSGEVPIFPWLRGLVLKIQIFCRWATQLNPPPVIPLAAFSTPKALLLAMFLDTCIEEHVPVDEYAFRYTLGFDNASAAGGRTSVTRTYYFSGLHGETIDITATAPHRVAEVPDVYTEYWRNRVCVLPTLTATLCLKSSLVPGGEGDALKGSNGDMLFTRVHAATFTRTRRAQSFRATTRDRLEATPLSVPLYKDRRDASSKICDVEVECGEQPNHWAIRGPRMFLCMFRPM